MMRIIQGSIILAATLLLSAASVSGSESELKISPENPVVGDEITIIGKASSNEVLYPSITYKEIVDVAGESSRYKTTGTSTTPKTKETTPEIKETNHEVTETPVITPIEDTPAPAQALTQTKSETLLQRLLNMLNFWD